MERNMNISASRLDRPAPGSPAGEDFFPHGRAEVSEVVQLNGPFPEQNHSTTPSTEQPLGGIIFFPWGCELSEPCSGNQLVSCTNRLFVIVDRMNQRAA
jgi:hypothetical protein